MGGMYTDSEISWLSFSMLNVFSCASGEYRFNGLPIGLVVLNIVAQGIEMRGPFMLPSGFSEGNGFSF